MDGETIVIVNDRDECIGGMDKLLVHQAGVLHRAFSIVLFDGKGNMLIQKRSGSKYHSPSLWANACCSHQRIGESLDDAAHRRLREELGLGNVRLNKAFVLRYRCTTANALIENEIDHVFCGQYAGGPVRFNPDEIEQVKWVGLATLKESVLNSESYAYWFRLIVGRMGPEYLDRESGRAGMDLQ